MKPFLLTLFVLFSLNLKAQSFREIFTEANLLTEDGYYGLAIPLWESLLTDDPENANLNFKLGKCLLSQGIDRDLALPYLLEASKDVKKIYDPFTADFKGAPVETFYYLGLAYHITSKLDFAQEFYNKFLVTAGGKHLLKDAANRGLMELETAHELMAKPLDVNISNIGGPINSSFAEYAPIVAMDENTIYFTSRRLRPDSTNDGAIEATTGMYFEDMYVTYRNINGNWMNPELLNINIPGEHSSVVSMSKNGRKLYIYRNYKGNDNIYESDFKLGIGWTEPTLVGSNVNSANNEYFAAITADESKLYFVSDRPGGLGGKDIWYCNKLPNGEWGKALNLGAPINSVQDEDAPFIHPDGKTLFFSSNGHQTMGGYDIFYSKLDGEKWAAPTNMGYPINTTDNDHSFITTPSGKRAYYSSRGTSSLGSKDIYVIDFKTEERNAPEVDMSAYAVLKGFIYDPGNQEIPDDLLITITNNATNEVIGSAQPVKRNGSFVFIIPSGDTYTVKYNLENKALYSEVIVIPTGVKYQEINREIYIYGQRNKYNVIALDEKVLGEVLKWRMRLIGDARSITIGSRVLYLDGNGTVIDTVYVSKDGYFEFKKLTAEFILKPIIEDVENPTLSIELIDNQNVKIKMININGIYYEKGKEPKLANALKEDPIAVQMANDSKSTSSKFLKTRKEINDAKENLNAQDSKTSSVTVYLGFNQTIIPEDEPDFTAALSYLAHYIENNGKGKVEFIASASNLPTSKFESNESLASERLKALETALKKGLSAQGLDINKISTIERKSIVSGPSYSQNSTIRKSDFIEFQYVRVIIN
jgi:tetratricopeptide (TPR) repeat protein